MASVYKDQEQNDEINFVKRLKSLKTKPPMSCTTLARRLSDLMREKGGDQLHNSHVESNEGRLKVFRKERAKEVVIKPTYYAYYMVVKKHPKNGIEEYEGGKVALTLDQKKTVPTNNLTMKTRKYSRYTKTSTLDTLDEAVKDKDITRKHEIGQQRQELDVRSITEFNECGEKEYCWSYIGQVGFNLLGNMYHRVLPEHYVEDWRYKLKDIEDAIEDDDLFKDTDERQKALKTWTGLKEELGWEPSVERTLKMLQREENPSSIGCSRDLTFEEAKRVAKELNKQGRLGGRLSYGNIQKVIEMWKTSTKWEGMEGP